MVCKMSTRKGNSKKQGQRHQNRTTYKNDIHDTSQRTKVINSLTIGGVCQRCKEIIDWKIKYKKYKPLKEPKKCTVCLGKTVRRAYYTVCDSCAQSRHVCAKCGQKSEIAESFPQSDKEREAEEVEFRFMLSQMKEREKRAFLREHTSSHRTQNKSTEESTVPVGLPPSGSCSDDDRISSEEEDPGNFEEEVPDVVTEQNGVPVKECNQHCTALTDTDII